MDFRRSQLERAARLDPKNGVALVSALKARARFGESSYLDVLQDRQRWNWSPKEVQDLAIKEVDHVLGSAFRFLKTASYQCGHLSHRIASFLHEKTEMEFLLLPGGPIHSEIEARAPTSAASTDSAAIDARVRPFLLSKHPVTQWSWSRLRNVIPIPIRRADHPAVDNSWLACRAWMRSCEAEFRFPTELEWEYAARAGSKSVYYWGDQFDNRYCSANRDDPSHVTHSVVFHESHPNAFGLVDMLGHVWEYTNSVWWDPQEGHATVEARARTLRGGSSLSSTTEVRCSSRTSQRLSETRPDVGLRVARSL